jgi:hypothetical protein
MSVKYLTLKNSWVKNVETYAPRITLSYPEWKNYISTGKNVLYADAVIPNGTQQTGFGQSGAVYKGVVRQGYGGF